MRHKTTKTPYTYKKIQEKNLPFTHANRTLLSDPIFYDVLKTKGFKWNPGDNQLTPESVKEKGDLGFIDVETTLFIILKEYAILKRDFEALKQELEEIKNATAN